MKIPYKTMISLFFFIIFVNISFRYPIANHEWGVDSFINHAAAEAVVSQGFDKRFVNFLSFFGLFPESSSMGAMFLLAGLSLITDLSVELLILFLSIFFGIFGAFNIYLFTKEMLQNTKYCEIIPFLSTLFFSLSNSYLSFTYWTYSYRGLFLSLFLLIPWAFLKVYNNSKQRPKFFLLGILLSIFILSIHRMTYFLIFFIMIIPISLLVYFLITKKCLETYVNNKNYFLFSIIIISVLLFLLPFYNLSFYPDSKIEGEKLYDKEYFINSRNIFTLIINILLIYSMNFGVLIILVPIGYIVILNKIERNISFTFLIIFSMFSTMYLADIIYFILFFQIFLSIFASVSFVFLYQKYLQEINKPFILSTAIVILLTAQSIPFWVVVAEENPMYMEYPDLTLVEPETYNTALYLRYQNNYPTFGNIHEIEKKIFAFSNTNSVDVKDESLKLTDFSLSEVIKGERGFFSRNVSDVYTTPIFYSILKSRYDVEDEQVRLALDYNLKGNGKYNAVVMVFSENVTSSSGKSFYSFFLVSLNENTYKIYNDDLEMVRFINNQN